MDAATNSALGLYTDFDLYGEHVKHGDCVLIDGTVVGEFQHARRERGDCLSIVVWTDREGFRAVATHRVTLCEASSGERRR